MEDDQQFCLRWNNHQSTLIQNFDTLLESGTLVDCTLAAEGKYLKAHKVVLSACSPYFEGLLSEHYDKHPVFILKDVKFKELKAMMDYMYRGEVNISQDQLTALLKAAESLQIKGLSDSRTGGGAAGGSATSSSKTETRSAKAASSTAATSSSLDIPHASSGLTIEKNSKVPRQSLQQVSVSDLPEDSASPQLRGLSSREGSQSPTSRKRLRKRKRSVNNDDTNSMENHEASNSSDVNISAPALGVAPVATEEKSHADPAETIGRSALMQQLTKPADEMLQIPIEKPEPSEEMIQPKSEYLDDQDDVEDLTNLDDDMNDLNEMEQDNSRAGPSHDPSQHGGIASWHISGDRSNASVVGAAAGPPGQQDEVFLAAHEAAQAQRDSQDTSTGKRKSSNDFIKILRVETLARPTSEKLQWKVVKRDNFEKFIMSKPKSLDPLAILQQTSTQSTSQKLQKKVPKKDNFTKLIIIPSKPSLVDPLSIGQETSAQSTGEKCQSKVVRKDNSPKIILNPNKPSIVDPLLIDQETSTQSTGEKSPEKVLKKDSFEKFFMNPDNPTLLDPLATIQETSTQPTSEKLPKKISKKDTLPKFFTNPDNPSLLDPLPVVQETLPRSTSEKLQLKVVRKDNFPKSILNPSKPSLLDPLLIELEPSTQSTSEKLQLKVIRKDSFPKSILNPSKPSLVDPLSIELEPSTQSTSEKSSEKVLEKDNLPKFFTNPSDPLLLDPLSVEQETLPQSTSETLQWKVLDKDNFQEFIVYQPVPIPSKQSSLDSIPMEFDVLSDSSETDGLQMKRLSTFEIKQLANEKIKQDLKLNKPVPTFKSKDEGIRKSTRKIKKKVFN